MSLITILFLIGCEPKLDNDTAPTKATKVLKSNFKENKASFDEIAKILTENPSISIDEAKCLDYQEKTPIVEKFCQLQERAKVILWSKDDHQIVFYTFESRNSEYWNGYRYILINDINQALFPLCKNDVLKNQREKDGCLHQLGDNWYLEHHYFSLQALNNESKVD
ncbi:MAG: hypothetical protein HWE16_01895 [Gammaproteobacteria bacterium]|nr:hypothetical protein [Gammaproteobacteria bacterium]